MLIEALAVVGLLIGAVLLTILTIAMTVLLRGYRVFIKAYREAQTKNKAKLDAETQAKDYMKVNYPVLYAKMYPKG